MNNAAVTVMRELAAVMRGNGTKIVRVVRGHLETYEVRKNGRVIGVTFTFAGAEELARTVKS